MIYITHQQYNIICLSYSFFNPILYVHILSYTYIYTQIYFHSSASNYRSCMLHAYFTRPIGAGARHVRRILHRLIQKSNTIGNHWVQSSQDSSDWWCFQLFFIFSPTPLGKFFWNLTASHIFQIGAFWSDEERQSLQKSVARCKWAKKDDHGFPQWQAKGRNKVTRWFAPTS